MSELKILAIEIAKAILQKNYVSPICIELATGPTLEKLKKVAILKGRNSYFYFDWQYLGVRSIWVTDPDPLDHLSLLHRNRPRVPRKKDGSRFGTVPMFLY